MGGSVPVSVNPSDTPNSIATTPSSCSTSSQYQELLDPQIPRAGHKDKAAVKVIAGESHSLKSQIYTHTQTTLLDFKISKNQTITHTIPETYKKLMYVLNGIAFIGDLGHETEVKAHHSLLLSEDGASTVRIKDKG